MNIEKAAEVAKATIAAVEMLEAAAKAALAALADGRKKLSDALTELDKLKDQLAADRADADAALDEKFK